MIEDLKWAAPDRYEVLKELARKNRLMPTLAETVLWEQIRGYALGTKFFRQYIIADYIVDFVSLQHNLVIEVDGAYHSELGEDRKQLIYNEIEKDQLALLFVSPEA